VHQLAEFTGRTLDQQNPNSKFFGEQFEIDSIRGYDRGPISAGRKSYQRIILEFLPLASVPILGISDLLDNHSSLPPVRSRRSPLDLSSAGVVPLPIAVIVTFWHHGEARTVQRKIGARQILCAPRQGPDRQERLPNG